MFAVVSVGFIGSHQWNVENNTQGYRKPELGRHFQFTHCTPTRR